MILNFYVDLGLTASGFCMVLNDLPRISEKVDLDLTQF